MTLPTPARGYRIAVLGSCVTRDAFEVADTSQLELATYMSRSALGSFMGRRTNVIAPEYDRISSNFQRRMVAGDIAKQGRMWLRTEPFDALVIDLIDERLPVARFADGGTATVSNEFRKLGIPLSKYTKIHSHTEESWKLWRAGWTTLVALLDEIGARDRIVVHRAYWVGRAADGSSTVKDPSLIDEANRWLDASYERMAADLETYQFIEVSEGLQVSDPEHKWGAAPYHYVPDYYREFLAKLQAFVQLH